MGARLLAGLFSFVLGAACFGQAQVLTQANDIYRSGVNASEVTLNTGNVSAGTFGPLFQLPLDGQAYAQPLYVPGIKMQDGNVHNLIITATEHDSVYAYDADSGSTTPLWQTSFINPSAGITTVPYTDITTANDIHPEIGITSTPVITLNQLTGDGVIYVTAKTKEVSGSTVNYVWRLHALDLITGQDLPNSPAVISASVPGTGMGAVNGSVPFIPMVQNQRPAILLDNGVLYLAFGSHGDVGNYHGWVLAYNPTTLSQVGAWCSDPNGEDGGIWQAGHGLADDGRGNIVFETGNGTYDPSSGNWGDSFVRLSPASSGLSAIDSFTPASQLSWDAFDVDLGSSGPLVIPSLGLVVGGGKDGRIYALNSSSLGGYNFLVDTNALQIVMTGNQQVISSQIALINGNSGFLYTGVQGDHIRAYSFTGNPSQPISTASSAESQEDPGSGAFMSISTNAYQPGTSILWATMTLNGRGQAQAIPGVLRAYDATTLKELYNSSSPPNNNNCFAKFVCPTVANGKVYVSYFPPEGAATGASIIGYGLLGNFSKAPNAPAGFSGVSDNGADELSWTPTSGALSYNVYRGPAGGPLSVLQSGVASACYKDTSVSNGSTYVYAVTAVNSAGESAQSSAVTCSPASTFLLYGNQCGTGSDGIFAVDANYSGGTPLANPLLSAAGTVYSSARVGTFTYTLSGIVPNANYTLTLYFDELQYTQPGQRLERVICNGHTIVVNLDLVQQAGAEVGFSQTFAVTGNQNGQITFTCEPMANSPVQSATLSGFTITGSSLMVPPITHNLQATGFVAYNSLTWDPTPGATTYNLYRGTTPGGETLYESGLHDTAFVDWETTYGQPYYYYVTSVNSHGEGMHSSEKSSTAYDVTPTLSVQNVTVHRGATVTFQLTLACSGSPTNNPSITPWYFDTNFLGKLELQGNSWPVNSPMTVTLICSRSAVVGASSVQICVTLGPDIHWVAVPITVT